MIFKAFRSFGVLRAKPHLPLWPGHAAAARTELRGAARPRRDLGALRLKAAPSHTRKMMKSEDMSICGGSICIIKYNR